VSNGGPTKPTAPYFKNGIWGWDGSQWSRLALVWGYSDVYSDGEGTNDAAAGANILQCTQVPAGEIWVVTSITATDRTRMIARIDLVADVAGGERRLANKVVPAAYELVAWSGMLVLKEDDRVWFDFQGCTAGDDLRCYAVGYKMKIEG